MYNVIAITREFGSLGRQIAKFVAEKMNYDYYDRDIIDKIAEDFDVGIKELTTNESKFGKGIYGKMMYPLGTGGYEKQERLYDSERKVIEYLAMRKNCVIVGRCADYILQDKADCLKVFIHADMQFRAERIVKVYGEREQSPEERLKDKDKRRAAYHRFYTDMKWGHAQNYHICLNSGVLGIDKCVDILTQLF